MYIYIYTYIYTYIHIYMAVGHLIKKKSERKKKVHLQTGAEPSQYRAKRNRAKTNQNRAGTEPSRAESQRSRAETERIRTEPCRKARGRHAEGARKAKSRVLAVFSDFVSSHAGSEPSRRRTASRSSWIGLGSTRIGSGAIGSGWVWIGCTNFFWSGSARTRRRN